MLRELEPFADQLEISREQLEKGLANLSIEQLMVPLPGRTWSIKDALARLAANESLMTDALICIAENSPASLPDDSENEEYLEMAMTQGRANSLAQTWQALDASREKLFALLEKLTPEELNRRGTHPQQGMLTFREFLAAIVSNESNLVRAILEHAQHLRRVTRTA